MLTLLVAGVLQLGAAGVVDSMGTMRPMATSVSQGRAVPLPQERTIAIDERLASDLGLRVGDRVALAAEAMGDGAGHAHAAGLPGGPLDTVRIAAIVARGADPSEIARAEYRVRLHLGQLQSLIGYGDRVDRFAVATAGERGTGHAVEAINDAAFGFVAHRSADIAVETSKTFLVVSRFHRAIGVITIVASAIFLLCILLLRVDERRRDVAALRLIGISRRSVVTSVVIEAAAISIAGSVLGILVGWGMSRVLNWYYQGVYRTPLQFSVVTPDIVILAVALSLVLGIAAGFLAALRLVRTPPLSLLGR
ncbi:MAG: ABC transporter permease [Gemmatimonadaceae bacterium]